MEGGDNGVNLDFLQQNRERGRLARRVERGGDYIHSQEGGRKKSRGI